MSTSVAVAPEFRNEVRLTLTPRGRVVVGVVIALATVVLVVAIAVAASVRPAEAGAEAPVDYVTVTVAEGENMWDLVAPHAPADLDIRDYILVVQEVNGLETTVLHPGQSLSLPIL